jgi:hypothetical protein
MDGASVGGVVRADNALGFIESTGDDEVCRHLGATSRVYVTEE